MLFDRFECVGLGLVLAVALLFISPIAVTNDLGFQCSLDAVTNFEILGLSEVPGGKVKICHPVEENIRAKKVSYLTTIRLDPLGVCVFDEFILSADKSGQAYQLGELEYQRMALPERSNCPEISSDNYTPVPLELSSHERLEVFAAIAKTFQDVRDNQLEVSEFLSGVSLSQRLFGATYREFKSILNKLIEHRAEKGRIAGISLSGKANREYLIYYLIGGKYWHLEGNLISGRLVITGIAV